jgi:hypothetical protein
LAQAFFTQGWTRELGDPFGSNLRDGLAFS